MNRREFIYEFKSFLIWALIYFVVIWLFENLISPSISSFSFMKYAIINYVLFGSFIIILSTLIHAGIKRNRFNFGSYMIYWIAIYSFLLWVLDFLFIKLIETGNFDFLNNSLNKIIVTALIFALTIKFVRRIDFGNSHSNRGIRLPRFQFGFFVAMGILFVAYYYSKSAHFMVYSMVYGIPPIAFWVIAIIIAFFAWKSIDK